MKRRYEELVLPDRIELFLAPASPLKNQSFLEPLTSAVYQ
jgi:hypothetical protein